MKLKKTTWILISLALLLGGFVYFYEIDRPQKQAETQANEQKLFAFQEEDLQQLTIKSQKETLRFDKTNRENNPWQMKQPEDVAANDASIAFLSDLLVKAKRDRSVKITSDRSKEYGLDKPLATIELQLKNGTRHQLILGQPDFEGQSLYALIDSDPSDREFDVTLVPKDFQYAVQRELSEWKQPKEEKKEKDSDR
jgi:hypothetical protein